MVVQSHGRWAAARASLKLEAPFDFMTTNDIVGGNSASPVINSKGELGLACDGNIQSLPGDFICGSLNRTIAVDVCRMVGTLKKVSRAEALIGELLAPAAVPTAAR